MADWLKDVGITTIAMESTGVYWIPAYELLEERGFEVCLVNHRHLKNLPGRKTDVLGCQWLQQLHKRSQFGPPKVITATAHKMARLVYFLIKYGTEYVDPEQGYKELRL